MGNKGNHGGLPLPEGRWLMAYGRDCYRTKVLSEGFVRKATFSGKSTPRV